MRKTAISIDAELLAEVKADAAQDGTSVSAWLSEAAAARLRHLGLRTYLDQYQAEFGAFTGEELAEAERELQAARRAGALRREQQRRAAS